MYIYTCFLIVVLHTYLVVQTNWFKLVQQISDPASFCKLAGSKICWTNLVQSTVDPTSLYELAGSKIDWTKLVQIWVAQMFDPASLYKLAGSKNFEPTCFKLVKQIVDPTSLYKLAQACQVRFVLNQLGANCTVLYLMRKYVYTCIYHNHKCKRICISHDMYMHIHVYIYM